MKERTRAYRFSGGSPAFPAQWFYGLLRALPGDRACLPPSLRGNCFPRNLMPASGHQDHTTSSYALARSSRARPRPSHPASRFVTIAHTPLRSRRDAQREIIVSAVGEAFYFSQAGWTTQIGLNCFVKFDSLRTRFPAPLNPDERGGVYEIELICPTGKKLPRAALAEVACRMG